MPRAILVAVQEKVLCLCQMKPGTDVLLKGRREANEARRLERRGLVSVFRDDFGVWASSLVDSRTDSPTLLGSDSAAAEPVDP